MHVKRPIYFVRYNLFEDISSFVSDDEINETTNFKWYF